MIEVCFGPTPNGQKVTIALEEAGLEYRLTHYDIFQGDQLTPEFGKINPNYKLPAIIDDDPAFGGGPHIVFETGAILQYIAEKTGKLLPEDPRKRSVCIQWLTWQVAGLGPMIGQAAHFVRYSKDHYEYPAQRYSNEVKRLLNVMEGRLGEARFLGGDEFSIADIATWPYWRLGALGLMNMEPADYPNSHRWFEEVGKRPGVERGMAGERDMPPKYRQPKATLSDEEWSNLFGDKQHAAVKR